MKTFTIEVVDGYFKPITGPDYACCLHADMAAMESDLMELRKAIKMNSILRRAKSHKFISKYGRHVDTDAKVDLRFVPGTGSTDMLGRPADAGHIFVRGSRDGLMEFNDSDVVYVRLFTSSGHVTCLMISPRRIAINNDYANLHFTQLRPKKLGGATEFRQLIAFPNGKVFPEGTIFIPHLLKLESAVSVPFVETDSVKDINSIGSIKLH